MTENAAAALFWVSVVLALFLFRDWDGWRAAALLLVLAYGSLARVEGILVALWFAAVLLARHAPAALARLRAVPWSRELLWRRRVPLAAAALLILVTIPLAAATVARLPTHYLDASYTIALQVAKLRPAADAFDVPTTGPGPNWGDYALRYEWDSAVAYHVPWFGLVALVGLGFGFVARRRAALVCLLALPYLMFVLMPPVTTFHPWFMRRLWIALIPLAMLLAGSSLDLHRVGAKWPVARGRTQRLRHRRSAVAAAMFVGTLLLLANLDITAPLLLARESDGSKQLTSAIDRNVPKGSVLIVDQFVVGYAATLRLHHGHDVIPWFTDTPNSFRQSFMADAAANDLFLVRLNLSAPLGVLTTDPQGIRTSTDFPTQVTYVPRTNHRAYLASPPLEQGYAPLASYLKKDVPPRGVVTVQVKISLVELGRPLVLLKNAAFASNEWQRTSEGMLATKEGSVVHFDLRGIPDDLFQESAATVHVAYQQVDDAERRVTATDGNQTAQPLEPPLRSDGSGTVALQAYPFPAPLAYRGLVFPAGTVLRGVYLQFTSA